MFQRSKTIARENFLAMEDVHAKVYNDKLSGVYGDGYRAGAMYHEGRLARRLNLPAVKLDDYGTLARIDWDALGWKLSIGCFALAAVLQIVVLFLRIRG
jgi:hypothetical protein